LAICTALLLPPLKTWRPVVHHGKRKSQEPSPFGCRSRADDSAETFV